MKTRRWNAVNWGSETLTEAEIARGWHFCLDYDGLLVGPGMIGELSVCSCEIPGFSAAEKRRLGKRFDKQIALLCRKSRELSLPAPF